LPLILHETNRADTRSRHETMVSNFVVFIFI